MLKEFIEKFLGKIDEYDNIVLFVHNQPDFDAYGSAFSLKKWIDDNYKNKKVFLAIPKATYKENEKTLFKADENMPTVSELSVSIGIILDTPNSHRVMTQLHLYCKELIIIDHHPKINSFAHLEFIDPTYPANSQILAEIFFYLEETKEKKFNSEIAQYLYAGILTDTENLMSFRTNPKTFSIISELISKGINRSLVHDSIFLQTLQQKTFNQHVILKTNITNNGLAYSVIGKRAIKKYKMKDSFNVINNLSNIYGVEVWTSLTYDFGLKKWKCSIRSKDIQINHIAKKFKGGGHKNMCAVIFEKKRVFYQLIYALDQYLVTCGFKETTRVHKFKFGWSFYLYSLMFKYCLKDKYLI